MTTSHNSSSRFPSTEVTLNLWALSGAVGIRIALPIILFIPAAVTLDKTLHTMPWITIGAIPISMITSIIVIKRDLERMSFIHARKKV